MLLRGLTYDYYGVGNWLVASRQSVRRVNTSGLREVRLRRPRPGDSLVRQTITVKSAFTNVLFALRPLVAVKVPTRSVTVTDSLDVRARRELGAGESYEVVSAVGRPTPEQLVAAGVARRGGRLQTGGRSREFRGLAAELKKLYSSCASGVTHTPPAWKGYHSLR